MCINVLLLIISAQLVSDNSDSMSIALSWTIIFIGAAICFCLGRYFRIHVQVDTGISKKEDDNTPRVADDSDAAHQARDLESMPSVC